MIKKEEVFVGDLAINSRIDMGDDEIVDILIKSCAKEMFKDLFSDYETLLDDYLNRPEQVTPINLRADEVLPYLVYARYKFTRDVVKMPTGDAKNNVQNMERVQGESGDLAYRKYCLAFNEFLKDFTEADGKAKEIPNRFGI